MTALLVVPVLAAAVALVIVGPWSRRLEPRAAAWLTTGGILVVVSSVLATSWVVSLGLLSGAPLVHHLLSWCLHPMLRATFGTRMVGTLALMVSALITAHVLRVAGEWWRGRVNRTAGVRVVDDPRALAYVESGPGGGVVVSTGMLAVLGPTERRAMLAHEMAHVRHRHDRFLAIGRLASVLPVGGPRVYRHLHFALERWADEDAALVVGNRSVVAHAVARAALAQDDLEVGLLGMAGGDIVGRVECLLATPPPAHRPALAMFVTIGLGAAIQLHHLPEIARIVC